ncbi:hypothetical protein ACLOJK_026780 [Asimina triloba]
MKLLPLAIPPSSQNPLYATRWPSAFFLSSNATIISDGGGWKLEILLSWLIYGRCWWWGWWAMLSNGVDLFAGCRWGRCSYAVVANADGEDGGSAARGGGCRQEEADGGGYAGELVREDGGCWLTRSPVRQSRSLLATASMEVRCGWVAGAAMGSSGIGISASSLSFWVAWICHACRRWRSSSLVGGCRPLMKAMEHRVWCFGGAS